MVAALVFKETTDSPEEDVPASEFRVSPEYSGWLPKFEVLVFDIVLL